MKTQLIYFDVGFGYIIKTVITTIFDVVTCTYIKKNALYVCNNIFCFMDLSNVRIVRKKEVTTRCGGS